MPSHSRTQACIESLHLPSKMSRRCTHQLEEFCSSLFHLHYIVRHQFLLFFPARLPVILPSIILRRLLMVSPGAVRLTGAYQTPPPPSNQPYGSRVRRSHSDRVHTPTCKSDIGECSLEPFSSYQRGPSCTPRPDAATWTCRFVLRSGAKAESPLVQELRGQRLDLACLGIRLRHRAGPGQQVR